METEYEWKYDERGIHGVFTKCGSIGNVLLDANGSYIPSNTPSKSYSNRVVILHVRTYIFTKLHNIIFQKSHCATFFHIF